MLEGISADLEAFYGRVVESLVAYVPPPPKLPKGQTHEVSADGHSPQEAASAGMQRGIAEPPPLAMVHERAVERAAEGEVDVVPEPETA